jgi:hypothetical protein
LRSVATAKPALLTKQGPASNHKHPHDEAALRSFPPASSESPLEGRALWEAAIQLDLVTVNTAEAQVTHGRTVAAWMAGLKPGAGGDRKEHLRRTFDRALLLALVMFNFLVLVALAAASPGYSDYLFKRSER